MRKPKLGTLSKSFDALLAEKQSLVEKEEGLIARLNKVLQQIGYCVERTRSGAAMSRPARRRAAPGRRKGRKQMTEVIRAEPGQKRRGRPPLRKVA